MDPEGILKACTRNCRMSRASTTAIRIASKYSLKADFLALRPVIGFQEGPDVLEGDGKISRSRRDQTAFSLLISSS